MKEKDLFLFILIMMAFIIISTTGEVADIITYKIIGYSEYQLQIYAVSNGTGNANTFINGSHHGREWITTPLSMKMIEEYTKKYKGNQSNEA